MHDARHEEPLSDAALDRAIEQALAVDHSPEFAARVRAHVADDTMSGRRWTGAWELSLGAAAASAVLVAAVWVMAPAVDVEPDVARTDAAVPHAATRAAERERPDTAIVGSETSIRRVGPATPRREVPSVAPRSVDAVETATPPQFLAFNAEPLRLPDVVIAPDEREALAWLLTPHRQETAPGPEPGLQIAELPDFGEIEVAGVVIEPLARMARLEGERP